MWVSHSHTFSLSHSLFSSSFLRRMSLDDFHHRIGVGRRFKRLTKIFVVKEFCDVGQCVKMFLKLALRNEKEHDEIDGLIVERVEVDSFF